MISRARPPDARIAPGHGARLSALLGVLARWLRNLTLLVALAGIVVGVGLAREWDWLATQHLLVRAAAVVVALVPAVLLGSYWLALSEVRELPGRVRAAPETARSHRDRLAEIARQAEAERGRRTRHPRALARLARLAFSARDDLLLPLSVAQVISPASLLLTAAAAVAGGIEVLLAAALLARWLLG